MLKNLDETEMKEKRKRERELLVGLRVNKICGWHLIM